METYFDSISSTENLKNVLKDKNINFDELSSVLIEDKRYFKNIRKYLTPVIWSLHEKNLLKTKRFTIKAMFEKKQLIEMERLKPFYKDNWDIFMLNFARILNKNNVIPLVIHEFNLKRARTNESQKISDYLSNEDSAQSLIIEAEEQEIKYGKKE